MTLSVLGLMISVLMLSLGAFFALRRLTNNAIGHMNADNARLKGILSASKELSTSLHVQAVAEVAVGCAQSLADSNAVLVIMRASEDKPLALMASSGEGAQMLFQDNEDLILELVESSLAQQGATSLSSGAESNSSVSNSSSEVLRSALACPLIAGDRSDGGDGSAGAVVILNSSVAGGGIAAGEQDALMTLSMLTGVALRTVSLQDAQRNFFSHITELLVAAMDTHIDGRKGHAMAVAQLSNRLARELSLPESRMERLHFAALLHDIGMLRIEQANQQSIPHLQKHPQMANRLLSRIRLWEDVAPIVLYHHEWFDGSGYPEAKSGEEIPFASRIIAVADCYDAMLRPATRRPAMTCEEALREILDHAGSQFDPRVTAALEQIALRDELPGPPEE
jgi:putative nucleotidyltransferase with HDIG domain